MLRIRFDLVCVEMLASGPRSEPEKYFKNGSVACYLMFYSAL